MTMMRERPFTVNRCRGVCSAPERASQHNAESLYAVAPPASAPVIETSSVWRRRCDCSGCAPYNLHYVEMPAAQGGLARLSLRGFFDRDDRYEQQRPASRVHAHQSLSVPTNRSRSLLAVQRSTVLAASRACGEWPKTATLDTAARDAGRTWPTALAVSG